MNYFFNTIIEHNRKCEPRESGSQSHPDCSRVDKGDADLDGDPAAGEPAAEEHGRSQLVGERRCDTTAEVPHGTLQGRHRSNQAIKSSSICLVSHSDSVDTISNRSRKRRECERLTARRGVTTKEQRRRPCSAASMLTPLRTKGS